MQKCISKLRRGLAALLACLTVLTCCPIYASADTVLDQPEGCGVNHYDRHLLDGDKGGSTDHWQNGAPFTCPSGETFPGTITATSTDWGSNYTMANSDIINKDFGPGHAGTIMHMFHMNSNGMPVIGYCGDHEKGFNSKSLKKKWNLQVVIEPHTKAYQVFLDYFYDRYFYTTNAVNQYGSVSAAKAADSENAYKILTDKEMQSLNAWVQACIWLFNKNSMRWDCFLDLDDTGVHATEQRQRLAKEIAKAVNVYGSMDEATAMELLTGIIKNWNNGEYERRYYAKYQPDGEHPNDQPIYIPSMVDIPGDEDRNGYAKLLKVDKDQQPLAGAVFEIATDPAFQNPIMDSPKTTGSDGTITIHADKYDFKESDTVTLYIREKSPAPGKNKVSGVWTVQVNSESNKTPETAALVSGGAGIVNDDTGGGGDSTVIIKKVDAVTGAGVGPAIFRIEGTGYTGGYDPNNEIAGNAHYESYEIQSDKNGNVYIQWTEQDADGYIPPGAYTVTEIQAPPGYELDDQQSRHLELFYNPTTRKAWSSGNLIFRNMPKRSFKIMKVSEDGTGLSGAVFEIYHDGRLMGSVTSGPTGEVEYAGDGNGVEWGTWEIVEVKPPDGYLLPVRNRQSIYIEKNAVDSYQEPFIFTFVDYQYPEILIEKFVKGTGEVLEGATFEVKIDETSLGTFKTDNSGRILIDYNTYKRFLDEMASNGSGKDSWTVSVREVTAPDGYIVDDYGWKSAELRQGQALAPFVFENIKYPHIRILKRDVHSGKPLKGAIFEVFVDSTSIGDFETDANGWILISYDQYKDFLHEGGHGDKLFDIKVLEKVAPEGYLICNPPEQTKALMLGQDELTFMFEDMKYPEIWVRKIDHETEERLAGMTFEVSIDGKKLNAQWTTRAEDITNGNDGWYKIKYEDFKEFLDSKGGWLLDDRGYTITVTETSAPQFYNKDRQLGSVAGDDYTLTRQLNAYADHIEFEFEDTHYRSLKVRKIDSETGWPLKGAEFTLRLISLENQNLNGTQANGWGDGVSKTGTTNDEGWYVFENLPNGTYELVESHEPQGYHGIDDEDSVLRGYWTDTRRPGARTITITSSSGADGTPGDASNRIIEYTYANQPKSGIKIFKKDGVTGHSIEGARFRITPLAPLQQASFERVTDANGLIEIESDLTNGTYMIEELEVPAPYHVDTTPQYIEVDGQHNAYAVTFNNYADGMVYIRKIDSKTGLPVAGAKFEIRKADGTLLDDTLVTGPDGYIDYGPLVPGESYIVTEIEAPPGYQISDPSVQYFTVPNSTSGWVKSLIFRDDPLCNLWLRKIDAETGLGLPGAVFNITLASGQIVRQNEITDQQGYIKVEGLQPGDYIVQETKAPNGYMLDSTKHNIHLVSGQTEIVLIENTKPGGLVIRKVDAATKEGLAGAEFQLYDIDDKPLGPPQKTGNDGYARWADLEPGQYQVEEITAPDGYARTIGRRKFEVKEFRSIEYEWLNAEEATITIYKRDGETQTPLAGAKFEIRDLNGAVVDTLVTDIGGSATSKKLPLGWYQVVETQAPYGYQIVETKSDPVEVKAGTPVTIERDNWSDKSIIIRKRDVNTQQPLQGAWFELQTISGDILQDALCTDASGVAITKSVEPGQYYLVETKPPEGYRIIKDKILVTVEDGKGVSVDIDNMPETIVMIYKTNAVNGDPIPNTEFALKDKHGKVLQVLMTDITGWAYSEPLPAGDYCVTETQAAPGYVKDLEDHWIEVEEGKNFTLMLKNYPGEHIIVTKVDATEMTGQAAASRKPLAGAVFELQTDSTTGDCMYIGTYTTDEYGKFEVEGVAPGFYRLIEKTAPDGYAILEEYTRICVKAGELNEFVIENVHLGSLIVKKVDNNDNTPIPGAKMRLTTVDGALIGEQETDQQGEAIWHNLKAGFYVVTEVVSPDGYDLAQCPSQNVEVKNGQASYVTFKDEAYGSLVIILQDKHTSEYLEGGQFTVRRMSDQVIVFDSKTDITGTLVVGNLAPGWYEVIETFAPNGYTIIESTQKVQIFLGVQQTLYFVNERGGLIVEKVDSQNTNILLEGARFKVTRVSDQEVIGEYVTDKSGTALVSDLTPGYYQVEEVGAPLGYEIDDPSPKMVYVQGGLTGHVTFMDTARASITINVVDKNTQAPLAGATVEVHRQNGEKVNEWTSDKTGMIQTEKMAPGYYVLKLTKVPEGYVVVLSEATVELKAGIETTYKFECTSSGSVTVVGKDEAGNTMAGVKFRVTLVDGTFIGDYVTGPNGTYDLSGLAPGNYIITWLSGPEGYEVVTGVQNITITANGSITVEIVSRSLSNMTVEVRDQNKAGLDNCKIEIWLQNGDLVKTVVTDKTGLALVEGLAPGIYVVKLISYPDGFTPVTVEQVITVTYNRSITVQFTCEDSGSLTVNATGTNNAAMAGVKFEVRDADGKLVGTYETEANGMITIPGLAAGKYVIVEVSCADGYNIPDNNKSIHVDIKSGSSASVTLTHVAESNVTIKVQDKNTLAGIANVRVEIWVQNGALIKTLTSDSTGVLDFGGMPNGFYVVKIVNANSITGYTAEITETVIEVKSGTAVNFTFNFVSGGGITVHSQDAEGNLIAGVQFEVKTQAGVTVGTFTTDATGTYVINNLDAGVYVITEISCPGEYNIDESTRTVTIEVKSGASVNVTLKHVKLSELNINAVVQSSRAGLMGVVIEIWQQNGGLINSFTSGSDGRFVIDALPNGFYVFKVTGTPDGYTAVTTETTIEIKTGVKVDYTFEFVADGILRVESLDNAGAAIVGMQFSMTDLNGLPMGTYTTGADGAYIFSSLNPGWYILTETKAPDGYVINEATKEQRVEVKAGESVTVSFNHSKVFGLQIRSTTVEGGAGIGDVIYNISTLEGNYLLSMTSDASGIAFNALTPGWYVITPAKAPAGYIFTDTSAKNIEVKGDGLTVVDFTLNRAATVKVHVIDATTGVGIYNVRLQLKDAAGTVLKEYYTNDTGYVTLDQAITAGGYVIEMISAPDGYIVDKIPHSIDAASGATNEITYKLYKEGGQIQVVVTSADYNKTRDLQPGTALEGALFEIENPDTYQIVGQMISDSRGIAASAPLPIGRYIVRMVNAPAYYAVNESFKPEVRIKVNNDVVRETVTVKSANLKVNVSQQTNQTAKAGSVIRVDMLTANNASDTRLSNFFVHIKVPTDAARIVSVNPGTWNAAVWYSISYKTNAREYTKIAANLSSENNYTFDLSSQSLGLQPSEYVTDVRFEFGTVPAGFAVKTKTTYGLYIQNVPNGYKMLSRIEAGGQSGATQLTTNTSTATPGLNQVAGGGQPTVGQTSAQWVTNTGMSTTTITNAGKLPKTGY